MTLSGIIQMLSVIILVLTSSEINIFHSKVQQFLYQWVKSTKCLFTMCFMYSFNI